MRGVFKMGFSGLEARAINDTITAAVAYYTFEYRVINQSSIVSSIRGQTIVLHFEWREMTPEERAAQPPREPPPHRPTIEERLDDLTSRVVALEQG